MGRTRLVVLFLVVLAMLSGIARKASAQSPIRLAQPNVEKSEPAIVTRLPLPQLRPIARGPEVFYCETPDTTCRTTQDTFQIADVRDLYVYVVWPGVTGQHVQTVQFYLPDGSIYSSKNTQFIVGGVVSFSAMSPAVQNQVAPAPPARHLMADANRIHTEGIHSLLTKSRGDSAILTVLPVGGTYITQRNLSGTWHVRVLLDDRVALESDFTLVSRHPAPKAEAETER